MPGSYRQIREGVWELRVSLGAGPTGRRTTKSRTIRGSEGAARAELDLWAKELGLADTGRRGEPTFGECLDAWFEHSKHRRQERSNEEVVRLITSHLAPLADLPLRGVDAATLEQLYARMARAGYSGQTIRHVHYVARPALRLAVRWGWIDRNPAEVVELEDLPPVTAPEADPPYAGDIAIALYTADERAADPPPPDGQRAKFGQWFELGVFLRVVAASGGRRSEAAALYWDNIDLSTGVVTIEAALSDLPGGRWVRKVTKTRKSRRRIRLDEDTLAVLELHRARVAAAGGQVGHGEFYVFPDLNKNAAGRVPVRGAAWGARFDRAKKAGLAADFTIRDLRHYHASELIGSGVDMVKVSARLGHARTSTTVDIYAHLQERDTGPSPDIIRDRLRRADA